MKENKLVIEINRSPEVVFEFVTNPNNTARWIDNVASEEVDKYPIQLGTVYKNINKAGELMELEMVEFEKNKSFVMKDRGSAYHVKYTITPTGGGHTEFTYFEWVEEGELSSLFTLPILEKLKGILEGNS